MWKPTSELENTLANLPGRQAIADLWALHYFVEHAVFSPNYKTDGIWADIITLSPKGEELIACSRDALAPLTRADLCLAIFGLFYYHGLLIDHERTDVKLVLDRVNSEFHGNLIKWPYLFGRLLYDRFNDTVKSDRTDHLESEEAAHLLDGTPAGVYQVGTFISGPYGLISSAETRYLPPANRLPLWHCSDTGCGALHNVVLTPPAISPVQAYSRLMSGAEEKLGQRSGWRGPLDRLFLGKLDGRPCYDLPVLIANAIIGPERAALVAAALRSTRASQLRDVLTSAGGGAKGTPEAIAEGLGEAEQLEILLTLADVELQGLIDTCVLDKRIDVPLNEIRTARVGCPSLSNRDRPSELSSLGLRSRPRVPLAFLHTIVWESYETLGLLEELGWKLRRKPGVPPNSALMDFIRASPPAQVVSELVLSSMPVTRVVCERFGIPIEAVDRGAALTELLLWKLGFNPSRFPDQYARFKTRIDEFSATVLPLLEVRTEEERARVRSVGVNLFVSVENFIQELVSYNTWLLASDHFVTTRFKYDSRHAIAGVPAVLGGTLQSGEVSASWRADGDNTLGTLLVYAQKMIDWIESLKAQDRMVVLRPKEDLPHYADDSEQSFVFRHTTLWADADSGELEQYVQGLSSVVAQLQRADIATIRNGLDHRRDDRDFPRADVMLACSARLRDALEVADARRYLPKIFWLQSLGTDRVGRQQFVFSDYVGREITLGGPPVVSGLPKPNFREPALIAPGNLLGEPNAELRFAVRERSVYAEYWANYPRRRQIPSPHRPIRSDEAVGERIE